MWWTGAPVFRVKMEPLAARMEPPTIAHVHRDGQARSAMSKWFPAKLPPISEALQCLDYVPTEEGAEILELLTRVTAGMDTGVHIASMNQTLAPAILATTALHATI